MLSAIVKTDIEFEGDIFMVAYCIYRCQALVYCTSRPK